MFVDQELVTVKSKWQSVNKIPCSSPSLACVDVTLLTTCTACDSVCVVFYHLRDALQVKLQVQTVREVFFKFWKMLSSMWIQGENVHWMSHFKDQLQAILFLQYACNLANTSNLWIQSIKRVVPWAADYFTHNSLYFPVGKQSTPHIAISRMSYFKLKRRINDKQRPDERMCSWPWKGRLSA